MINLTAIPPGVRNLYTDVPHDAGENAQSAIRWLRAKIRPTAIDDAAFLAAGIPNETYPPPLPPHAETLLLVCEISTRLHWPGSIGLAALNAEWRDAQDRVRDTEDKIRREVWPLAKMRKPGHEMIAAAERVCSRDGVHLPIEHLTDLCRKIAQATVPQYVRRK